MEPVIGHGGSKHGEAMNGMELGRRQASIFVNGDGRLPDWGPHGAGSPFFNGLADGENATGRGFGKESARAGNHLSSKGGSGSHLDFAPPTISGYFQPDNLNVSLGTFSKITQRIPAAAAAIPVFPPLRFFSPGPLTA